jgi:AraC family transcriptional regulator
MHAWEAVQKTLNYIEEHINEEIQVEDLAEIAALSLFYYQRLFTRLVKKPVREYIKLRRLSKARDALCDKENRILDVALEYGFVNHETFTRAFKDAYGITPSQYRNKTVGLISFDKPDLMLNYIMIDEGVPLISDGLVLEINRKKLDRPIKFLGVKGYFPFVKGKMRGEETGIEYFSDNWRNFFDSLCDIPHKIGGRTIGVYYHGDAPEGYTTHFVGAESDSCEEDARFNSWQLHAREYVVCSFEVENYKQLTGPALSSAMKYTRFWLKKHDLIADGFFPEMYYNTSPDIAFMELWIPFRQREL